MMMRMLLPSKWQVQYLTEVWLQGHCGNSIVPRSWGVVVVV